MRKPWTLLAASVLSLALAAPALAKVDGAGVYRRCFGCHQSTGGGIAGVFPPLAGHAGKLAAVERSYPIQVVLFGLKGEIEVEGKKYNGVMTALGSQLNDEEIAAVLNYVLASWGNDKLLPKGHKEITPPEVKVLREKKLTPEQVYGIRQKLTIK
ncbi:MAG: cytochrome c [Candidatus Deferrimicrobiaceae bacterium]